MSSRLSCVAREAVIRGAPPPTATHAAPTAGAGPVRPQALVLGRALRRCRAAHRRRGDARQLVLVQLRQPGVTVPDAGWQAVGMAAIESGPVDFDAVPCVRIGGPGAYLDRPGFWHGGAGVAACWLGAANRSPSAWPTRRASRATRTWPPRWDASTWH
ncbi:hypothetical protein ACQYVW_04485 [Luteimonas sp. SDU82]